MYTVVFVDPFSNIKDSIADEDKGRLFVSKAEAQAFKSEHEHGKFAYVIKATGTFAEGV